MKNGWIPGFIVFFVAMGIAAAPLFAETSPLVLEPVVVTASKAPRTQGNVTQKVNVISDDDMDRMVSGNGNMAELLTYSPGIFVSVLSRNDANWGSSGGLSQKYNTYMLDGLPIDAFVEPQSLDPMAFERIEVQRGPAAVLYPNYLSMDFAGNQSPLTGTTNLILKERIDRDQTRMDAYYGTENTYGLRFFHQQSSGNLHMFLGGSHESSDYTNYGTDNSWLNMLDDPEYEKTKLYFRTTLFFNNATDHKLSVFANRTGHDGDTGRPNRDFDHEYWTLNAAYTVPVTDGVTARAKLGYRKYDRTWENDHFPDNLSLASEDGVEQTIVPGDLSLSIAHGAGGLLTLGGDFQHAAYETFSETDRKAVGNDANAWQYGLYFQEELAVHDFIVRFGGRYSTTEHDIDRLSGGEPGVDSKDWDKFLWSAGVRYNASERVSVYGNVGSSFVAPSLKSVGGTISLSDKGVPGKNGQLPNPGLDPEEGIGSDLGVDLRIMETLKAGLRGFYNVIDDQIVQVVVSEDPSQSQDINAGDTVSYGVEAELRQRLSGGMGWFANYTYTHTEIDNDRDPDQDGAEVPFVPEHMGNVGIDVTLPGEVTASIYLHLAGEIYDSTSKANRSQFDSYELLNASIQKRFIRENGSWVDLYMDLYNLTDNEYKMPWQFQDPGFSAVGGVRLVF